MCRVSLRFALVLFTLLPTLLCSGQQSGSGQNASAAIKKPADKTSLPDTIKGELALAYSMSINGPGIASLWIKSDDAQYEIVFTQKTKVPPEWRQVNYVGHEVVGVPGLPLYIPRENNVSQQVGYRPDGQVMMLSPVAGRYSVRGKITVRPQGGHVGRINASEVKELTN
jgi:hypothetical protein